MEPFAIEIAGVVLLLHSRFGSTKEYFRAYLTEKQSEFAITVEDDDLLTEQKLLNDEADAEGLRRRVFSQPFLERSTIMRKTAHLLLNRGILLLHGSTVAVDGKAYLFTAASGVGKSTHTRLWREVFQDRAVMVNDDRAFLKREHDGIYACGSPWTGKHGIGENLSLPLCGICVLKRGNENVIIPIRADGKVTLQGQLFVPYAGDERQVSELAGATLREVPLWQMTCTKSTDAARIAYDTMS